VKVLYPALFLVAFAACTEHDPELGHVGGTGAVPGIGTGGSSGATSDGGCVLDTSGMTNPSYPCEILAVIGPRTDGSPAKCQRCHNDPQVNGAPFSLLTWPDTQKIHPATTGKPIWQKMHAAVESNFMPLCAGKACASNFDPPTEALTTEERTTLLSWLECPVPVDSPVCQ
jgi:hypothetical protein